MASGAARPGSGGDETGTDGADVERERVARQPLFRNLAFKMARGVRLDVVFDALLCGPDLGFTAKAGVVRDLDLRGGGEEANAGRGGGADERSIPTAEEMPRTRTEIQRDRRTRHWPCRQSPQSVSFAL